MKEDRKIELTPEVVDAILGVHSFFNDKEKVSLWFRTKNLNLGGCSPIQLIRYGRTKKLVEFINDALDSNKGIK